MAAIPPWFSSQSSRLAPVSRTTRRDVLALGGIGLAALLSGCADDSPPSTSASTGASTGAGRGSESGTKTGTGTDTDAGTAAGTPVAMTVWKDVTCGCCSGWIDHMGASGFDITTEHPEDLATVFAEHDVPPRMQSCHLGLTADGDVIVGHVPARFVHDYLADRPKGARGLSVPAMPVGTPGMEQGDQFDPYEVMLLTDGEPRVHARVTKASQQI